MKLTLIRISNWGQATSGVLLFNDSPIGALATLEDAWLDNQKNLSCIPSGKYAIERVHSPKFGNTFEVKYVPNRTSILFHAGNSTLDTSGCILLGLGFLETADIKVFLAQSQKAFKMFLQKMDGVERAGLEIINSWAK